jgi:hypothetical protein
MKNRTLVTCLRQFNPELIVSIRAELESGCEERGHGSGDYEGHEFSQDYTVSWNDGHLSASEYDGYTVGDVIKVLLEKTLSEIGNDDFNLRPGELMNGYTEYDTTWEDEEPEDLPEDDELYHMMEHGESEYEWFNARYIEFEVHYKNQEGEDEAISFVLNEDEVDKKPDPLDEKNKKVAPKKKAAKKAAKKK